jgi:hypothetical protein
MTRTSLVRQKSAHTRLVPYFCILSLAKNPLFSRVKRLSLLVGLFLPLCLSAQIGGRHVYDFLNLSPSPRQAALGGVNISTYDHDAVFAYQNPSLLNDSMSKQASFAIANYLSDITYGYTSYAHSFEGIGTFHAGVQYLSYGKMIESDIYGNQLGTFKATDMAIVLGGAHKIGLFSLGANVKLVNSNIQRYRSHYALGMDLGGTYVSEKGNFVAGMAFKNIGVNLTPWNVPEGQSTPLPFELQLGVSHKLEHMPLRFSLTTTNLQTPKLIYYDKDAPPEYDLSGELIEKKFPFADNLFRHAVFGAEFLLSKGFNLRAGYNHMRRQELRAENRGGISGFSFGAGIKIKWFRFDYALSSFHAVGPTHHFMLATNIGSFKKR